MYEVALISEYLVITGRWIKGTKVARNSWVFPGQRCTRIELSPAKYTFEVQAMSAEKVPLILQAVFIIGPRADDRDNFLKYAKLTKLVEGVIKGETRALVASIFKGTKHFKQEVFHKLQLQLNHFGLLIYNANANAKQQGHNYFSKIDGQLPMKTKVPEVAQLTTLLEANKERVAEAERVGGAQGISKDAKGLMAQGTYIRALLSQYII